MNYYFADQVELNEIEDLPRDENTEAREQLLNLFEILFEAQVWFCMCNCRQTNHNFMAKNIISDIHQSSL